MRGRASREDRHGLADTVSVLVAGSEFDLTQTATVPAEGQEYAADESSPLATAPASEDVRHRLWTFRRRKGPVGETTEQLDLEHVEP